MRTRPGYGTFCISLEFGGGQEGRVGPFEGGQQCWGRVTWLKHTAYRTRHSLPVDRGGGEHIGDVEERNRCSGPIEGLVGQRWISEDDEDKARKSGKSDMGGRMAVSLRWRHHSQEDLHQAYRGGLN